MVVEDGSVPSGSGQLSEVQSHRVQVDRRVVLLSTSPRLHELKTHGVPELYHLP